MGQKKLPSAEKPNQKKLPSAIRSVKHTADGKPQTNIVGARLRAARELRTPRMTLEFAAERATALSGYNISKHMLVKVENNRRAVYDYEVPALALALGVDVRYLLGVTDDPGPLQPIPLRSKKKTQG